MPVLQEAFREQVRLEKSASPERPLFIGGKSMGGRVASLLVEELAALRTPTLILQGERDHSFKPTRSSGLSEAENWATAVAWSDGFLRGVLGG